MEILKRIPSRVKTDLLRNDLGKSELSDEAVDLLNQMLRFDISQRIKLEGKSLLVAKPSLFLSS